MEDKDIQPGVIYGVAPRWEKKPLPVVVLEDRPRSVFFRSGDVIQRDPQQGARPSAGDPANTGARGYAAVTGPVDSLKDLDCAAELTRFHAGLQPSRPGLEWTLITQLSQVFGPYEPALRDYQDNNAALTTAAEAREREVDAAIAALAGHGITDAVPGYHNATITLPAVQVQRLLAQSSHPDAGRRRELADVRAFPDGVTPAVPSPAGQSRKGAPAVQPPISPSP